MKYSNKMFHRQHFKSMLQTSFSSLKFQKHIEIRIYKKTLFGKNKKALFQINK